MRETTSHSSGTIWANEGTRWVTIFAVRLPSPWKVAQGVATYGTVELDEAFQGAHGSPALALHQINNVWTVAQFGNYVMPSLPAFTINDLLRYRYYLFD